MPNSTKRSELLISNWFWISVPQDCRFQHRQGCWWLEAAVEPEQRRYTGDVWHVIHWLRKSSRRPRSFSRLWCVLAVHVVSSTYYLGFFDLKCFSPGVPKLLFLYLAPLNAQWMCDSQMSEWDESRKSQLAYTFTFVCRNCPGFVPS